MNKKAIIFGISGLSLTKKEKTFFKNFKPWGIILFSRNIKNIPQLKKLISQIKYIFRDKNYPILIDQEGGKVSRINKIIDLSFFSQHFFSELYKNNKKVFLNFYKIYIDKVCEIFKKTGININTVPVLDVQTKKTHKIIGTRSFSNNPAIVSKLGKLCINFYHNNKIATAIKHLPGHGESKEDSHNETPIVNASKKILTEKDFKPFIRSKSLFGMTAHVIYSSYDSDSTATHSKKIIREIIRRKIKFKGILMSDDISMKSLKYKLEINAIRALNSGCNLVLHCNGKMSEMIRLAKVIPNIDNFTKEKTYQFYKFLR
tara:strand:+ start:2763 stop:3710 length:948 start_codon:yes stop_codon:yes gene_type:complete